MNWKVFFEKDSEGFYTVTVPSLPGCISQGKSKEAALKNIKEAIELHLTSLAEDGIPLNKNFDVATVSVRI